MGPTKIMIIRHAEKPVTSNGLTYNGINEQGGPDEDSLIPQGWERAGAVANVFYPINNIALQNPELKAPNYIYASNPNVQAIGEKQPSRRPYQTISALYEKMLHSIPSAPVILNKSFEADGYPAMVTDVLKQFGTILIAWQHQDILPHPATNDKKATTDGILLEFLRQTKTPYYPESNNPGIKDIPTGPWPGDRFDMIFVLDRDPDSGYITHFTQVPQQLLAGDRTDNFTPTAPWGVSPNQ